VSRLWPASLSLGLLDVSIVTVALTSIQLSLGASAAQVQWMVSGYAHTFGLVLVVGLLCQHPDRAGGAGGSVVPAAVPAARCCWARVYCACCCRWWESKTVGWAGCGGTGAGCAVSALGATDGAAQSGAIVGQPAAVGHARLTGGSRAGADVTSYVTLTLEYVPPRMGGVAAGALQTGQRIGSAIGTSVLAAVFYGVPSQDGHHQNAIAAALRIAMGSCLALFVTVLELRAHRCQSALVFPCPILMITTT